MKTLYTAHATVIAGREGHATTDDKRIDTPLSAPGSQDIGTNPEQLFACGYAACFGSAVQAVAKKQGANTEGLTIKSDVTLNQDESGYFIGVTLNVALPNLDNATAEKLVQQAHQVCPYSKATRGNIEVKLQVSGNPIAQAA